MTDGIPTRRYFTNVTTLYGETMEFEPVPIQPLVVLPWPDGRNASFSIVYINDIRFENHNPPRQEAMDFVQNGIAFIRNNNRDAASRLLQFPEGRFPNVNCVGVLL